jgi:hypothetical protein
VAAGGYSSRVLPGLDLGKVAPPSELKSGRVDRGGRHEQKDRSAEGARGRVAAGYTYGKRHGSG